MISLQKIKQAKRRGAAVLKRGPIAVAAHYDASSGRVVVDLSSGLQIAFHHDNAQDLENGTTLELEIIEVTSSGLGLYFPKLDADLYIPGIMRGVFGSKAWSGAQGGVNKRVSKTIAASSRVN